jgi:hypothetical protein
LQNLKSFTSNTYSKKTIVTAFGYQPPTSQDM